MVGTDDNNTSVDDVIDANARDLGETVDNAKRIFQLYAFGENNVKQKISHTENMRLNTIEYPIDLPPNKPGEIITDVDNKADLVCSICLTFKKNVLIMPCKHIHTCLPCIHEINKRAIQKGDKLRCPMCNQNATFVTEVYY